MLNAYVEAALANIGFVVDVTFSLDDDSQPSVL